MWGPASLIATSGISLFQQFLPKFSEIRAGHPDTNPDLVADVRMGEVAACTLTMGTSLIASSLIGSPAPAVIGLLVCISLVMLYESVLNANNPGMPKPRTVVTNDLGVARSA